MAVGPQYYQTSPYPPQNYNFPPHPAAASILHHPGPPPTYGIPQYPTGYCPAPAYQPQIAAHQQMYNVGTVPQVNKGNSIISCFQSLIISFNNFFREQFLMMVLDSMVKVLVQ